MSRPRVLRDSPGGGTRSVPSRRRHRVHAAMLRKYCRAGFLRLWQGFYLLFCGIQSLLRRDLAVQSVVDLFQQYLCCLL